MLRRLRTFPKIPFRRIPRIPLSTTTSSPSPPPPPEPAADAEENSVVTREEAYRKIRNLDFSTATKILFTTPPKNKKFGLDFHLVQLFFVCLPSLGVYLVAQYARYEMRRMEAEAEQKKKQAEEEEKARNAELAPREEGMSDAELSKVLVRLGALEEVVREIVKEKKRTPHADLPKKDKELNKSSDPQSKPNPDESKQAQNKVAAGGSSPTVSAPADDSAKAKDKGWKEAIAVDNVRLILSPERETLTCNICVKDSHPEAQTQPLEFLKRSVLGNAENRMTEVGLFGPAAACASKPKFRQKHEKSVMLQYVIVDAAIYLAKRSSYFQT